MTEIEQQITALEHSKEYHYQTYLKNLRILDDKMDRIEQQIERTKSQVKRDLLKRHLDWFENEVGNMDEAIDVITDKIDSEIKRLCDIQKSLQEKKEREKKSFEYNIENIRKCVKNRSTASMFDALESVANALEIMMVDSRQT